jgi:voltage-gated potassium channel
MQESRTFHQVQVAVGLLVGLVLIGALGYMLIEGWNFFDALYMTVISITTTGFAEVHPLSHSGRLFTIVVIVLGVVTIAYTGGRIAQLVLENYLLRRRRMSRKVSNLKNHYIICGFGRMGKQICLELQANQAPFVVVENDPAKVDILRDLGYLYVEGDATQDEVLARAGIKQAKGLVAVLPTEAENVFTTLSAKVLNPEVFIVSRAVEEETESKLIKAGANRVVKPYEIGGHRMAQVLLRPGVVDFIDIIARETQIDLQLEEVDVHPESLLVGMTLAESPIRKQLNIIIVAIFTAAGKVIYNPQSRTVIHGHDRLIVIGEEKNIQKLVELAAKP